MPRSTHFIDEILTGQVCALFFRCISYPCSKGTLLTNNNLLSQNQTACLPLSFE